MTENVKFPLELTTNKVIYRNTFGFIMELTFFFERKKIHKLPPQC